MIGSRVMSTPAKSRPRFTISRSASSVRLRGTTVTSRKTPAPSGPTPRPSLISICSAREDHVLGAEGLHAAGAHVARDDPGAAAGVVEHQRGGEPLLVALDRLVMLEQLLVEDVEHRLAGDVGDVGGALHRGAAERAK